MIINRTFGIVLLLMGLLLALTPRYILPVCEYQGYPQMSCSNTGIAEVLIGVIVMATAVGIILSKT
ncbi:MAG TPA: DUF4418 family protein, partial [Thermodesulfovibrionales bacterium]|nr:DUF4418 family protein [Thermodesulfovibrionales bacterium]